MESEEEKLDMYTSKLYEKYSTPQKNISDEVTDNTFYSEIVAPIASTQPIEIKTNLNDTNNNNSNMIEHVNHKPANKVEYYYKKITIRNLPWWTSDRDIETAINHLGINDIVQITFKENRSNGISLGIATIEFTTENGYKTFLDNVNNIEFYGCPVQLVHPIIQTPQLLCDQISTSISKPIAPAPDTNIKSIITPITIENNVTLPTSTKNNQYTDKPSSINTISNYSDIVKITSPIKVEKKYEKLISKDKTYHDRKSGKTKVRKRSRDRTKHRKTESSRSKSIHKDRNLSKC